MIIAFVYTEVGFFRYYSAQISTSWGSSITFHNGCTNLYSHQVHEFPFCHIHTNSFLSFSKCPNRCGVVSFCVFNVHFLCYVCHWIHLCTLGFLCVLVSMSVYFPPVLLSCMSFLNIFISYPLSHRCLQKFPSVPEVAFWFHWLFLSQAEAFHVHFCFCCLISGDSPRTIARFSMTVFFSLTLFSRSVTGSALTLNPSVDFKSFVRDRRQGSEFFPSL